MDGRPHDHAFTSAGPQLRYARASHTRDVVREVIGALAPGLGLHEIAVFYSGDQSSLQAPLYAQRL